MEASLKIPSGVNLKSAERILWYDRRSLASYLGHWVLAIILFLVLLVFPPLLIVPILIIIWILLNRLSHEYALTNFRAIAKRGIVSRELREAPLQNVTDTALEQGIGGRIFNYGTVMLNTAGLAGYELAWVGVKDPVRAREKVGAVTSGQEAKEKLRARLERLEDKLLTGEITQSQYERARGTLYGAPPLTQTIPTHGGVPPPPSEGETRLPPPSQERSGPRYCPNCGTPVQGGRFCSSCGTELA
jgi:hypothetical protein